MAALGVGWTCGAVGLFGVTAAGIEGVPAILICALSGFGPTLYMLNKD
jgi:hypothetical protein